MALGGGQADGVKRDRLDFQGGMAEDGSTGAKEVDGTLEIAGVMGSVEDWRDILLPLLKKG